MPGPEQQQDNTGDPWLMRGKSSPIASWAIQRAANMFSGVRSLVGAPRAPMALTPLPRTAPPPVLTSRPIGPPAVIQHSGFDVMRREPWFGPGQPQRPMAPRADVAGRQFDYRVGENMQTRPRAHSGISFEQLRGLADSLDVARLCIETRKDQIGALTWTFLPKQEAGEQHRRKSDDRCRQLNSFFASPDRRQTWDGWVRMLLEELFVIDASSIYVRRTKGGDVFALDIIDGSTIKPLLDVTGREPAAPAAAFQQVLKGMPAIDYSADELIYAPRNRRANHIYGLSVVEQIVLTVNIAIRREVVKLQYFTEGNVPEALVSVPNDWTPDQVTRFQVQWDALLKVAETRSHMRFVPGQMVYQPTRSDGMLMGPFDEWIARVVCFAFSLPPTAFVQQQNRATADTAKESALEEGLRPTMVWLKGLIDRIVAQAFGWADIELVWDDIKDIDVKAEREQDRADMQLGILSIDDLRAKRGLDPIGIGPAIYGGPNGLIFLDDLLRAKAQGLTAIQPPQAPQYDEFGNPVPQPSAMMGHNGGPPLEDGSPPAGADAAGSGVPAGGPLPSPGGSGARPNGSDPLAGIPADILAAVGLGPQGAAGRAVDVTRADEIERDPELAHVGHAQVLATLRAAEAMHKRAPRRRGRTL